MALVNPESQLFLDGVEFTEENIRELELVYGKKYVSTGGERSGVEFLERLGLHEDDYVIDIGCGLGGSAFYMAHKYGAKVLGIDLSTNMVSRAKASVIEEMNDNIKAKVNFEVADVTWKDYLHMTFDFIVCRESAIYIEDKHELFADFLHWLKPGGKLLIVDYCYGESSGEESDTFEFEAYLDQKRLHMLRRTDYDHLLEKVGFQVLDCEDRTAAALEYLNQDLARLTSHKADFLTQLNGDKETRQRRYDRLLQELEYKIHTCANGIQSWGVIVARKP